MHSPRTQHNERTSGQRSDEANKIGRVMTAEWRDGGAFVVVSLEREDEPVSKIMEILEPLGIPIEVVGRGRQLRRTPSVVFRVPHHLVTEAILALELQGFPDVFAYQIVDSPTMGE